MCARSFEMSKVKIPVDSLGTAGFSARGEGRYPYYG